MCFTSPLKETTLEPPQAAAMAPKKNRIKGESCPDRATPPSKAGATKRQRQVKKLQKAAELYTPFAPFVRLVKEITESCPSQVKSWTPEALLWLQEAADFYLNETFDVELLQLAIRTMHASSTAGKRGEHAGGSPEEAEEKPNGLVKRV